MEGGGRQRWGHEESGRNREALRNTEWSKDTQTHRHELESYLSHSGILLLCVEGH